MWSAGHVASCNPLDSAQKFPCDKSTQRGDWPHLGLLTVAGRSARVPSYINVLNESLAYIADFIRLSGIDGPMSDQQSGNGGGVPGYVKTPPPRDLPLNLEAGKILSGNYEVAEQIGEGGMAVVYKARQTSLNRFVAIKALHPRFASDEEFIGRFEAESGALASLSHPNIINIIDRGHDDAIYFFVMELVDGETLDEKIIENTLTPNDWRGMVEACRDALEYVHKRGVVHRDIKPSNILMNNEGRIKIGDFGIAHILAGDDGEIPSFQGPTRAVGTAHYMAPEQTSDPANVDHRADVYSLAVTFYKMLTRQLPIGEFPAPSEANHEVPVAVDQVIFQAMAPNPEDRFQSVREFCDTLLKALKDQSMSITSILNYRGPASSSLYTGDDFTTRGRPSGENKKPDSNFFKSVKSSTSAKPDTRSKAKDEKSKTGTKKGSSTGFGKLKARRTPIPEGGRVTASRDLTPLPVPVEIEDGPPAKQSHAVMYAIIAVLAIVGLTIIIAAVAMSQQGGSTQTSGSSQPLAPMTNTESPARERERIAEEIRQQREADLLRQQEEDTGEGTSP